jgi:hypothetical protein
METITYTGVLVVEECCVCGMTFAMPEDFQRQKRKKTASTLTFYCPAGHSQHYTGESAEQREKRWRHEAEARARAIEDQFKAERKSHSATKGQLTKVKRRAAAGVCPCCTRTFQNVQRHMETQHPDYVEKRCV